MRLAKIVEGVEGVVTKAVVIEGELLVVKETGAVAHKNRQPEEVQEIPIIAHSNQRPRTRADEPPPVNGCRTLDNVAVKLPIWVELPNNPSP